MKNLAVVGLIIACTGGYDAAAHITFIGVMEHVSGVLGACQRKILN